MWPLRLVRRGLPARPAVEGETSPVLVVEERSRSPSGAIQGHFLIREVVEGLAGKGEPYRGGSYGRPITPGVPFKRVPNSPQTAQ